MFRRGSSDVFGVVLIVAFIALFPVLIIAVGAAMGTLHISDYELHQIIGINANRRGVA
jgi:hypothetical protein